MLMKPAACQLSCRGSSGLWRSLRATCGGLGIGGCGAWQRRCLATLVRHSGTSSGRDGDHKWPRNWRMGILEPHARCPLPGGVGVGDLPDCQAGGQAVKQPPAPFVLPSGVQPAVSVLPPCMDSERSKTVQEAFHLVEETFPVGSYPRAEAGLEFSLAPCPQVLKKHLTSLFPRRSLDGLTVITLAHRGHQQLQLQHQARERLLDALVMTASEICQALRQEGFWSDFIDPASGRPFLAGVGDPQQQQQQQQQQQPLQQQQQGMSDFEIADLGCCKLVLHYHRGRHALPQQRALIGSVFTDAPADHPLLLNLIKPPPPSDSSSSGGSTAS